MSERITNTLVGFPLEDVITVYIGKTGCACGCGGKYYYKDIRKKANWQLDAKDQKTNNKMIKMVYNKIKKLAAIHGATVYDKEIVEVGNRAYRLYFKD